MAAIRIERLSKTYRAGWNGKETTALRNLNLEVQEGEIFGFLGPNGAGKTTTIHLLLNLIRPTVGAAYLFDCPATETEVHRRLGYLPETVNLHDYYRGRKMLEFYAALARVPPAARSSRVTELLKLLQLEDAANKVVARYSKGMAQRIGFAQAMLQDPDLLILDEPTSSLDPVGRKEFRDILLELKQRGKTVFISSHILSEVESVCDRVAILQNGELKRVGTLEELSAGRMVRLIVKSLPAPVVEALSATTAQVTLMQGQITIRCPDEATCGEIERLLEQHHVEIAHKETEAQSLEEIFFSSINQPPRL
ncbi:MAG TPA: ABC transporter ATP-binding protein [Verrucomicrobiae bacterium]|nr:ABC transporter ATP-binding protein [Verrucomicrobiae bacterium]